MKIFKYPLINHTEQYLQLPYGFEVLSVGVQDGDLFIWAIVDPDETEIPVTFFIVGTGQDLPPQDKKFIGTVHAGIFVWHVFQEVS